MITNEHLGLTREGLALPYKTLLTLIHSVESGVKTIRHANGLEMVEFNNGFKITRGDIK